MAASLHTVEYSHKPVYIEVYHAQNGKSYLSANELLSTRTPGFHLQFIRLLSSEVFPEYIDDPGNYVAARPEEIAAIPQHWYISRHFKKLRAELKRLHYLRTDGENIFLQSVRKKEKVCIFAAGSNRKSRYLCTSMKQHELFKVIYEECEGKSWVSGKSLVGPGHQMFHWQFAHVLPKGPYRSLKFSKDNILPMTADEHINQTNGMWIGWSQEKIAEFKKLALELKQKYYASKKTFPR